ncbi:hypothetical protein ACJ2A9_10475 [Anaerobacillus sp. MEB173]|uniref:hypothetical protein n=1 Tax=Anaerobacillus sp. MEB173 TaxID=3383345 RepID=UPI003F937A8F
MFPFFFNKNFLNSMMNNYQTFEMKAPNGSVYRFSSNSIDQETFNNYAKQLENATKNNDQEAFDQIWQQLKANSGVSNLDKEFQRIHEEMNSFFEQMNPFLNHKQPLHFHHPKLLTSETIDEKIKYHQEEIKRLQSMRTNNSEKQRNLLEGKISKLRVRMDEKLKELSENLHDPAKKQQINDELTLIHREIKQLENEISSL